MTGRLIVISNGCGENFEKSTRNFPGSIPYTERDIVSPKAEPADLHLSWSRSLSLTARILAVNLFVLALFAGGLFFLDSYRGQLIINRESIAAQQAAVISDILPSLPAEKQAQFLSKFGTASKSRIRVYDRSGVKILDSFDLGPHGYALSDPKTESWKKRAARVIDQSFDFLVMAPKLKTFVEPSVDNGSAWDVLQNNRTDNAVQIATRLAPDFTHVIMTGTIASGGEYKILAVTNAREIRQLVRAERLRFGIFFVLVLMISILLSLFLARTIVRPLRRLAHAAIRVRLGRAQEVTVPRLPSRRDEIGMLARALSDMSTALRQRIDATEAFAADVAHEIKNPLASLRSALDGMDNVTDPALRAQLMAVAKDDVFRMDRLISDISEASRVDAQLAKAKFELIDIGDMAEQLLHAREERGSDGDISIAFARPRKGVTTVWGEDIRLERVLNNLIDNAVSFSPPGGLVQISVTRAESHVLIRVSDEGPGVPPDEREAIFRRFHSERPKSEEFGKHSGLGLAIARTIVEGHEGAINVLDRADGQSGACFEIALPAHEASVA
ncbi:MAG: sensor N-terminal transmembrane domain-containing protein [Sphingorhabdus sp.]|nr:sensor N-terminal transmembrane domain-containing protein [Sphingorhabdus sp.]